jgi:hypothetical protein
VHTSPASYSEVSGFESRLADQLSFGFPQLLQENDDRETEDKHNNKQDGKWLGRGSKQALPKYRSRTLPLY